MSHSDASTEADFPFRLDSMQFGEDATGVWGESGQHLTVTGERNMSREKINDSLAINLCRTKHGTVFKSKLPQLLIKLIWIYPVEQQRFAYIQI